MRRQLGRPLYNTCGVPRVIAVITVLLFGRPPCFCSTVLLCGQRVQAARAAGTKGVAHRRATRGWRFEPCRPVRCVCFRVSPVHGLLLRSQLPRDMLARIRASPVPTPLPPADPPCPNRAKALARGEGGTVATANACRVARANTNRRTRYGYGSHTRAKGIVNGKRTRPSTRPV